ncbi:MAG: hypothetical protein ACI8UO_006755 [Verrucomicrobiales bacterium]|jgi:hypothetical protein
MTDGGSWLDYRGMRQLGKRAGGESRRLEIRSAFRADQGAMECRRILRIRFTFELSELDAPAMDFADWSIGSANLRVRIRPNAVSDVSRRLLEAALRRTTARGSRSSLWAALPDSRRGRNSARARSCYRSRVRKRCGVSRWPGFAPLDLCDRGIHPTR